MCADTDIIINEVKERFLPALHGDEQVHAYIYQFMYNFLNIIYNVTKSLVYT